MNNDHPTLPSSITTAWLLRHGIAPIRRQENGTLDVLVADTANSLPLDVLGAVLQSPIVVVSGDKSTIRERLMDRAKQFRESVTDLTAGGAETTSDSEVIPIGELLGGDPDNPTVIRVVNAILAEAVVALASDVHLEPDNSRLRVRYRIDGMLEDREPIPTTFSDPVVSRIKVMSKIDISNRHHPQDGSFNVTFGGHPVDVRVSTVPTPGGERVVMRLLDRSGQSVTCEKLGMPTSLITSLESILNRAQGLLLVAGPTGSGKTTTLYACLNRIDTIERNTITIEDPVEYLIPGVSQVQVGRDRTLGFADGLRSILRQDPDVILVGEIRDRDTASTALQAALTGHLILSTIHTMDPASSVIRLLDLGVDPPLIAETLTAVMDQRLVRTLCEHCAEPDQESPGQRRAVGCPRCRHSGYAGRTGLFRYMALNADLRKSIRAADHQAIREMVDAGCGNHLLDQAKILINTGRTTMAEVQRIFDADRGT